MRSTRFRYSGLHVYHILDMWREHVLHRICGYLRCKHKSVGERGEGRGGRSGGGSYLQCHSAARRLHIRHRCLKCVHEPVRLLTSPLPWESRPIVNLNYHSILYAAAALSLSRSLALSLFCTLPPPPPPSLRARVCVCVRACVLCCACVRACCAVRACCVRVRACVFLLLLLLLLMLLLLMLLLLLLLLFAWHV